MGVEVDKPGRPIEFHRGANGNPWRSLGRDSTWRYKTSVGVISAANQTHFITTAIIARLKLTLVFDGAGGH
jgi:hypothetical protein